MERADEDGERRDSGGRKDGPLDIQRLPEDVAVPERTEPQRVHVVGKDGLCTEQEGNDQAQEQQDAAARGSPARKIDGVHVAIDQRPASDRCSILPA